jgi:hypothetical protein
MMVELIKNGIGAENRKQREFMDQAERFRGAPELAQVERTGDQMGADDLWPLMPKIETWENLPQAARRHLSGRMRDRAIGIADLNSISFASGSDRNRKFWRTIGTGTSARLRFAVPTDSQDISSPRASGEGQGSVRRPCPRRATGFER